MADGVKKINELIMKEGRILGITKNIAASKFEGGTFFVDPNNGTLKYNSVDASGSKAWRKFSPSKIFDDLSITRSLTVIISLPASTLRGFSYLLS